MGSLSDPLLVIDTLMVAALLLLCWPLTHPPVRGWLLTVPLLVLTTATTVALAIVTRLGDWWSALLPGMILATVGVFWHIHLSHRRGRPARLVVLVAGALLRRGRLPMTTSRGRRMQTLAELRAEYGQGVLDDAVRDPLLHELLDIYADTLAERLRRQGLPVDLLLLTSFANGYVDAISDPGPARVEPSPYRGYSTFMLTIAALCRLADRVPALSLPERLPGAGGPG